MKTAIVTGAGKGIGKAIAHKLCADGFFVHACDKDESLLAHLKTELSEKVDTHIIDITDHNAIEIFFQSFHQDSQPTFLVNNAGIYLAKEIMDYTYDEIQKVFSTNVYSTIQFTKYFAEPLLQNKQRGVIVNISSIAEYGSRDAIYGSSKGAIAAFTRSCAINFSPYIRVNNVAPGPVKTDMIKAIPKNVADKYRKNQLIEDPILAEDVAGTVKFLLSEDAKHYTGATFDLNNGVRSS